MWLIKKFMQKIKIVNVKWTFENTNLQQSCHLELLKFLNIHVKKVSMHFTNKLFIWQCFIFNFYFDIFFESIFFIFFLWQT